MSAIRAADLRLVLPRGPRHVEVDPSEPGWAAAIADLDLGAVPGVAPDLAVGSLRADVPTLLLPGRPPRARLRAAGYAVERILVRPGPEGPRLAFPLGNAVAARLAFAGPRAGDGMAADLRRTAVRLAAARGLAPADSITTLATRVPGPPYPLAHAVHCGVDATGGWFASFGDGDDIQRAVLHAIPAGSPIATTIVKVGRVPGYTAAFDADAAGLALLDAHAPRAAARAPRILGRFDVAGLAASAESAAPGPTLNLVLDAHGDAALPHVDRILDWIVELGRESRGEVGALGPELARLASDVLPMYEAVDPSPTGSLLAPLASVPPVLAHRDPGSWNIAVDGTSFMVFDWESSAYPSVPLWDTAYLLADACSAVDGPAPADRKVARIASLFAGEHRLSGYVFDHLRTAAAALDVPDGAIGPSVTTGWLHHGRSRAARAVRAGRLPVAEGLINRVAARWLEDPRLGVGWRIPD